MMRPTRIGPAMVFNKVKGYDDVRVVIGVLGSRKRVARLLNTTSERLGFLFKDAVATPDFSSGYPAGARRLPGGGAPRERSRVRHPEATSRSDEHRGGRRALFYDGACLCRRSGKRAA